MRELVSGERALWSLVSRVRIGLAQQQGAQDRPSGVVTLRVLASHRA